MSNYQKRMARALEEIKAVGEIEKSPSEASKVIERLQGKIGNSASEKPKNK